MKKSKKLIPAIAMLMVSAILLTSASYAWFTMSREVTATGMNVKVTAPTNLLISADNDAFAASATKTQAADVINPASSVNGVDGTFYALKNGSAVTASTGARTDDSLFAQVTNTETDKYYVDFTYYVKTEGNEDVDVYVKSAKVTRNGNDASDAALTAVRAAIINKTTDNAANKRVVAKDGATISNQAIKSLQEGENAGKVIGSDLADINTNAKNKTDVAFVAPKNSAVQTIVVRVWFDGEDANCNVGTAANLDFNVELVLADASYTAA